jgi:dihydrofolate reductase
MRKLVAITHVSLDGVVQAPGGVDEDRSNGFTHGGWTLPFRHPEGGNAIVELVARDFDLLLGRRTYENFASFWPNQLDNPIGKAFNKATKYVATRTLDHLSWETSRRIDDAAKDVRELKASEGPELHVWGSGNLLQTLIAADLVDEYHLLVYPVVLGEGKRLFENGVPPRSLTLVETRSTPTGVLINTYRPPSQS